MEQKEKSKKTADKAAAPLEKKEDRIIALLEEINGKIPEAEEYEEDDEENAGDEKNEGRKKYGTIFWTILWPLIFLIILLVRMIFLFID